MNLFCCSEGKEKSDQVDTDKLEKLALSSTSLNESVKGPKVALEVYPLEKNNQCYAKLNIPEELFKSISKPVDHVPTIVILDRSGSMSGHFHTLLVEIIPKMLKSIGYSDDYQIELITFDNIAHHTPTTVKGMSELNYSSGGGTEFAPAVKCLKELMANCNFKTARIITISDGEIADQKLSQSAAADLASFLRGQPIAINSVAVRYFTSTYGSPDTSALCCLLQLSTIGPMNMIEVNSSLSKSDQISLLKPSFSNDGLNYKCVIGASSGSSLFKVNPWDTSKCATLALRPGQNEFWISDRDVLEKDTVIIEGIQVKVVMHDSIKSAEEAAIIMKKTITETTDRLKVLKIVDTPDSLEQIRLIVAYYQEIDRNLTEIQVNATNDPALSSRIDYLKKTLAVRSRGFFNKMAAIANDDSVSQLNAAQKAEYLRSTDASKTSRGLARRALKSGLNFDEIARTEAKAIAAHLHELRNLPEETNASFYSLETTLGGLRSLKELVEMDTDDGLTAVEILQVINIVGMAARGQVGDYPDPMTYRLDQIYPNCFVSISDLLTAQLQGGKLTVPGFPDEEITTVVPVFEDFRLAKFLKKHAPSLLSYSASIGMRGMVADITMTDGYTLCSGIWKLVEEIYKSPTELKLRTFKSLCDSYDLFVGNYFEHVDEFLVPAVNSNEHKSMFLGNFGTTNMIAPLYRRFKKSPAKIKEILPQILRALFNYEMWQAMRRIFRSSEKATNVIEDCLNQLLGVDFEKYGVKPAPLFQEEPKELNFCNQYYVNWEYLEKELIAKYAWYVKYVALLPVLLEASASGTIMGLKVPEIDESFLKAQLDIDDMQQYWFLLAAQAFMFPYASKRSENDATEMLIPDLKWPETFKASLRDYCAKQYRGNYDSMLRTKTKAEIDYVKNALLDKIFAATSISEAADLLRCGHSMGSRKVIISSPQSIGYIDLRDGLIAGRPSPIRSQLIRLFLLTRIDANSEPAFNDGKVVWVHDIDAFERAFIQSGGKSEEWEEIKKTYTTEAIHVYRLSGKPNRHTHHNEKPSYWAVGFATLEDMRKTVSPAEFLEYCRIHHECCGVNQLDLNELIEKVKN